MGPNRRSALSFSPHDEDGFEYLNSYCVAAGRSVSEAPLLFSGSGFKGLAPVKAQK